jgi:hypothetical protein
MIAGLISGVFGLFFMLIAGVIGLAYVVFWLCMLVHAITNKGLGDGEKIVWVLVLIFLHVLGPILYFFLGRPKAIG